MYSIGPITTLQERNNPDEMHNAQTGNENAIQMNESNNIHNSNPTLNRRIRSENSKKIIKVAIKVASLNILRFGHNNPNHIQNKWKHVNQIMRDEKIAILLLQETHMNVERQNKVQMLFERRLNTLCSEDPESPTQKGGVAIVLNKCFIPTQGASTIKTDNIVGGRALLLTIKLNEHRNIKILAIYAPNDPSKNRDF